MKTKGKIARLTPEENHAWEFAFCFYRERCRTDSRADMLAWRDLKIDYPRLKKFNGCSY
jgi:hypothetical protein